MSCEAWHELLIALLDQEIEPDERARLESHLEGCAECRADLAELKASSALLRRWETIDPPSELVFVHERSRGRIGRMFSGWGRSVLLPAGLGAALATAVSVVVFGDRGPDPRVDELRAEMTLLRDRVAAAETAAQSAKSAAAEAAPVAAEAAPVATQSPAVAARSASPATGATMADLTPETRRWLLDAVDRVVRESESRQDAKLVLAADQLARSLAIQRRDDLSLIDRRLRDAQAETFEALVSTHQRLDRLAPPSGRSQPSEGGERLETR